MNIWPNCGVMPADEAKISKQCRAKIPESVYPITQKPIGLSESSPVTPYTTQETVTIDTQQIHGRVPLQQNIAMAANVYINALKREREPAIVRERISGRQPFFRIEAMSLLVLLLILLILPGCAIRESEIQDPNLGVYNATSAEKSGVRMDIATFWEGGVSIELKGNNKCTFTIKGKAYGINWCLEGNNIIIEGKGLNLSGTLIDGTLILENFMDSGVSLTFIKDIEDGGTAEQNTSDIIATSASPSPDDYTELQFQWNGTWYGTFHIIEARNISYYNGSTDYNAMMVITLDHNGMGVLELYGFNDYDSPLARGECEATEASLFSSSVQMWGQKMTAYNWMLLPRQDYTDQYCLCDTYDDGEAYLDFILFLKPWGASWKQEIADGYSLLPPSIDEYNEKIAAREAPPVGFSPIGYTVSSDSET